MKKGTDFFTDNEEFNTLNNELTVKYDSITVSEIWKKIAACYDDIWAQYSGVNDALKKHLKYMIPYIAVYKVLYEDDRNDALELVIEQAKMNAIEKRKFYEGYSTRFPGLFIKKCRKMAKGFYAEKAGFEVELEETPPNECKFVIKKSPYLSICTENSCTELVKIFSDNDLYYFANLPKIAFKRNGNLESEEEPCEYHFTVREQVLSV
ncbi:MAG: L-2-amino-thiazoline-4-carboxylic acid hydrolase [Treponema sp.]|nr:L-2-amino-thiazoline-4-carboxylic acid hydrolase [Treponema sp.]